MFSVLTELPISLPKPKATTRGPSLDPGTHINFHVLRPLLPRLSCLNSSQVEEGVLSKDLQTQYSFRQS